MNIELSNDNNEYDNHKYFSLDIFVMDLDDNEEESSDSSGLFGDRFALDSNDNQDDYINGDTVPQNDDTVDENDDMSTPEAENVIDQKSAIDSIYDDTLSNISDAPVSINPEQTLSNMFREPPPPTENTAVLTPPSPTPDTSNHNISPSNRTITIASPTIRKTRYKIRRQSNTPGKPPTKSRVFKNIANGELLGKRARKAINYTKLNEGENIEE